MLEKRKSRALELIKHVDDKTEEMTRMILDSDEREAKVKVLVKEAIHNNMFRNIYWWIAVYSICFNVVLVAFLNPKLLWIVWVVLAILGLWIWGMKKMEEMF